MLRLKRLNPRNSLDIDGYDFDDEINKLYDKVESEDLFKVYFYDGSVKSLDDLYSWAYNFPLIYLCYKGDMLLGFCAFGAVTSNYLSAFGHFCVFKDGRENIEDTTACLFQAMRELSKNGTKTIIGITPIKYRHALKFVQERLFFEVMYTVPDMVNLYYKNNMVCDGVLSICKLDNLFDSEKVKE